MTAEGKLSERPKIGVLSPLVAGSYSSNLIAGVATATAASGTRVVAIQTLDLDFGGPAERLTPSAPRGLSEGEYLGWPPGTEALVPHFALRPAWDQVAGFLVILNAVEPWYLHALREAGKPVVVLSHEVEGFSCPVVRTDNRSGIAQAVSHLIEHGHRSIAFAGCLVQTDITERLDAYRDSLAAHGIEVREDLIYEATDNLEGGGEVAAQQMLAAGLPSTAVVAATDYNALGIIRALARAGRVLPRDQAIVGFDDVPAAALSQPTLSTVHQSFEQIARTGADLLIEIIQGVDVPNGRHLVPTVFMARESCGCSAAAVIGDLQDPVASADLPARERLLLRLERLLVEGESPTGVHTAAIVRAVDLILSAMELTGESAGPARGLLAEAAAAIYSVSPRRTTLDATVACLRQYLDDVGVTPAAWRWRYGGCITDIAVELSGCISRAEAGARAALHEVMTLDHELSVSLLSGTAGDPKSLGWLAHTPARAGCMGLWADETRAGAAHHGALDIAGSYLRGKGRLHVPARTRVESFPPDALLEDLEWRPGEIAIVFPTKTPTLDLGLLAVVTRLKPAEESGRDRLFEDNALLSVALERDVMTERLRRSDADLATFSHAMAHDLRNPLATISMWASVAHLRSSGDHGTERVLEIVDQIKEVADYATELVADLLHYAELDSGRTASEPVDLNVAAARVIATVRSTVVEQAAVIEAQPLPTVPGRAAELQLVLQNLIENAAKYRSDRRPRITLDAVRDGGFWKLRCHDNGKGIETELRRQIFEPFARGNTSLPGSGLGLATCRRIVEGHGGRIWIEASGESGTTVVFTLPAGAANGSGNGHGGGTVRRRTRAVTRGKLHP